METKVQKITMSESAFNRKTNITVLCPNCKTPVTLINATYSSKTCPNCHYTVVVEVEITD